MKLILSILLLAATNLSLANPFPGIGRPATKAEISAWDIDVRPDLKGLPVGKGSVAKGMDVWDAKCASCHGTFGESNQVFNPIIGGTTKEDAKTGRVANLMPDKAYPQRTTMMKLSSVSTLWDYINRAMPWTQPKTLSVEEVYAVTAYILNLADIVPDNFVLSNENMQEVQGKLPNRNGKTLAHAMWPGKEFASLGASKSPDVKTATVKSSSSTVSSQIPEHAKNAHGNLAEQNRPIGPQRGQLTLVAQKTSTAPSTQVVAVANWDKVNGLLAKNACSACHGMENQLIGPSFKAIAKKYGDKAENHSYLSSKIRQGGAGVWGQIPMPAQNVSEDDAKYLSQWLMNALK